MIESPPEIRRPAHASSDPATFDARVAAVCASIARGDSDALADLYQSRFDLVYLTARAITRRDESFGLDAAQETFLRVLRSGRGLADIASPQDLDRWLVRATHTAALDLLRKERRRAERERRAAPREPHDCRAITEEIDHLRRLLRDLDTQDQTDLTLRLRGQTLNQIADQTHTSAPATHGRIRRALARLSQRFKN